MIKETLIRPAQWHDGDAIGRIYVESWRATYRGILPSGYLSGLCADKLSRSVRLSLMDPQTLYLIADSGHGALGYIAAGRQRGQDPIYETELYELYLLPEVQGQGLGRKLLADMARRLHDARFYTMMVWVLARNPNRCFYEKRGALYLGSKTIYFAGSNLQADAFGWIDITLAME